MQSMYMFLLLRYNSGNAGKKGVWAEMNEKKELKDEFHEYWEWE